MQIFTRILNLVLTKKLKKHQGVFCPDHCRCLWAYLWKGVDPDTASVISFTSSIHSLNYDSASFGSSQGGGSRSSRGQHHSLHPPHRPANRGQPTEPSSSSAGATASSDEIDGKIECVDSLVSLLGCTDVDKMSRWDKTAKKYKSKTETKMTLTQIIGCCTGTMLPK